MTTIHRDVSRIKSMFTRGYGPRETARRLQLHPHRVHNLKASHIDLPDGLTLLTDLAKDLGVTAYMLRNHNTRGILPASWWAGRLVYTKKQAEAARAYYAAHAAPDKPWLTVTQAARELGCDPKRFHRVRDRIQRQHGVEIRRVKLKGASGNTWRYCPEDVTRAARCEPRRFRGRPRDHVLSKTLADMAGVGLSPPVTWASKGCPHVQDHLRRLWFRPADVLAWLRSRPPHRQTAPVIARLSALLEAQEAA